MKINADVHDKRQLNYVNKATKTVAIFLWKGIKNMANIFASEVVA